MKGQEMDSHRYGIFAQQPSQAIAASCQHDNKENLLEVSDAVCVSAGKQTTNTTFLVLLNTVAIMEL